MLDLSKFISNKKMLSVVVTIDNNKFYSQTLCLNKFQVDKQNVSKFI